MSFLSCGRLGARPLLATLCRVPTLSTAQYAQAASGTPKITLKKFEEPTPVHHDVRNERLNRPLSPHITIYAFPVPAVMSITHRTTGIILSSYVTALGLGALMMPNDVSHYISMLESMPTACLFVLKAALAAPFAYHFANGVRHLYWDTAKGLTLKEIYTSGYAIMGLSVILTLALAAL